MSKLIERQLQSTLLQIFSNLIKEKELEHQFNAYPSQEEGRADVSIKDSSGRTIAFIELKDPLSSEGKTVYHYKTFKREFTRASKNKIKIFGVCNFLEAVIHNIDCNETLCEYYKGEFLSLNDLSILRTKFVISDSIERRLYNLVEWFLTAIREIYEGRPPVLPPLDERFIRRIKSFIDAYVPDTAHTVYFKYTEDKEFKRRLQDWASKQFWTIPGHIEEIISIVHIAFLLYLTKLIFYKALYDENIYSGLPKLVIPARITAIKMRHYIWDEYFNAAKVITKDYELLIGDKDEVINEIPFLNKEVIDFTKGVVDLSEDYNFKELPYDIIGRIFEDLIRGDERHTFGQYFTPSLVVDLINSFCIRTGNEVVLDPSCGSGTFLVRAYSRKQQITKKPHTELLKEIYGVDISSYACELAQLNLAVRDLRVSSNYPHIVHKDFFEVGFGGNYTVKVKDLNGEDTPVVLREVDAVIGNPPYTRQEELDTFFEGSKDKMIGITRKEWCVASSGRSSIYAYFFYHAGYMLKENGYLGFITSNSWLDVDYGKDIQKWMLDNFRIIAVIDSKVERFFPSADVNTAITILQKESKKEKRDKNIVRFVYFKKPLTKVYEKLGGDSGTKDFIEKTIAFYEDEHIRIKPTVQDELYKDYKWGKYLKAPEVFWKIFNRGSQHFVRLGDIAEVKRGCTTGANEFFYVKDRTPALTDADLLNIRNNFRKIKKVKTVLQMKLMVVENGIGELWLIEKDILRPVVKSPRDIISYTVTSDNLKTLVFLVNKTRQEVKDRYPFAFSYIKDGEKKGYSGRPSMAGKREWWFLDEVEAESISVFKAYNDRMFAPLIKDKIFKDCRIYEVKHEKIERLFASLNSTVGILMLELFARSNLGEGGLTIESLDDLIVIDPNLLG